MHYQHSDSPTDADPPRPGRHCGPDCDLYQPPADTFLDRTIAIEEAALDTCPSCGEPADDHERHQPYGQWPRFYPCDRAPYADPEPRTTAAQWADDLATYRRESFGPDHFPREIRTREPLWDWYRGAADLEATAYSAALRGAAELRRTAYGRARTFVPGGRYRGPAHRDELQRGCPVVMTYPTRRPLWHAGAVVDAR